MLEAGEGSGRKGFLEASLVKRDKETEGHPRWDSSRPGPQTPRAWAGAELRAVHPEKGLAPLATRS